ncbi:MAG: hypothetical protein JJU33_07220 [Phycisphaerales bacterium]|nr:hypothetical protein [Phycisphaerales bacterium]
MLRNKLFGMVAASGLVVACGAANAQEYYMVVSSTSPEGVVLIDRSNNQLVDADWIRDQGSPDWSFTTPKEAIRVGDEIWVSDQLVRAIHRFSLDSNDPVLNRPQFVGSITGDGINMFNNIRGMAYDGTNVYLTMAGTAADLWLNSVIIIDPSTQQITDSLPVGFSPFDVELYDNDLLIADISGNRITRHSKTGAYLGDFVAPGFVSFPQQVVALDNGDILVASFSSNAAHRFSPQGAELERATRVQLGIPSGNIRGIYPEPGQDSYLVSASPGVYRAVPDGFGGMTGSVVYEPGSGHNGQYISLLDLGGAPACPPDLNGDGVVDADDFFLFLQLFADGDPRADFNNDGVIDADDFFAFLAAFAAGC